MCLDVCYIRMDEVDERIRRFNERNSGTVDNISSRTVRKQSLFPAETRQRHVTSLVVTRYSLRATCYLLSSFCSVDLWHPGVAVDSRKLLISFPVRWKYQSAERKAC